MGRGNPSTQPSCGWLAAHGPWVATDQHHFLISILFYFKIDPFVLIHVSYLVFRYYVCIFGFLLMIIWLFLSDFNMLGHIHVSIIWHVMYIHISSFSLLALRRYFYAFMCWRIFPSCFWFLPTTSISAIPNNAKVLLKHLVLGVQTLTFVLQSLFRFLRPCLDLTF